ncbi:hypothetical protein D3C86_2044830 [compost metagenome]
MRRFKRIATNGGMSHSGLKTNALMESDAARKTMNSTRVTAFRSIEKFSHQRRRRLGWKGGPFVSPR